MQSFAELCARNLSAAIREASNARLALDHVAMPVGDKDKLYLEKRLDGVLDDLNYALQKMIFVQAASK